MASSGLTVCCCSIIWTDCLLLQLRPVGSFLHKSPQTHSLIWRSEVKGPLCVCVCVLVLDLLVVFGSADDGDGLRQHQLVGTVSVEVDAGEEGRLSGMSLNTESTERSEVRGHTVRTTHTHTHTQICSAQRCRVRPLSGSSYLWSSLSLICCSTTDTVAMATSDHANEGEENTQRRSF